MSKLLGVMVLGVLACAPGCASQDTVTEMCQRAQDCNDLGTGVSVQDCIDDRQRCVDKLTSSQRGDWERMMGSCLQNNTCSLFANCYVEVPWC